MRVSHELRNTQQVYVYTECRYLQDLNKLPESNEE
jgi:hypothetical protein